jgi:exopolysaccharide biosynthesis polyprenyl glycosylphosphotransferase
MTNGTSIAVQLEATLVSERKTRKRVFASVPLKKVLLCACDVLLVNLALILALMLRDLWLPQFDAVAKQFTIGRSLLGFNILHAVWLFVLYSVGLYDIQRFASRPELIKRILLALAICGVIGLTIFYSTGYFKMTPKVFRMPPRSVLALDLSFLALFLYASRELLVRWSRKGYYVRVMLCGNGGEVSQFREFLDRNSHVGYKVSVWLPVETSDREELLSVQEQIQERLLAGEVDIVTVTRRVNDNEQMRTFFYRLLCAGTHVSDFTHLYEEVTGKIPCSLINEGWFIGSLRAFNRRGFELAKRLVDLAAAIALGVPSLLLFPVVAFAIKLESLGPIIFRQKRVGRDGRVFNMLKFRTMLATESRGAHWAADAESRITRIGRFLRKTRIDELPQLWNVLKGEMSFVGPRPEWTELYAELTRRIPFYEARTLVRPGLTGWAQINFGYGASVEDDKEKLQYDLYYIKHRSIFLDLSILLKTASTILRFEGR